MRRCGTKKFVWAVIVCDYESAWAIAHFDSEAKARTKLSNHKLKNNEQDKWVSKYEIF